jgi:olefin beta-lactone synthetase
LITAPVSVNVAQRLGELARTMPRAVAVAEAVSKRSSVACDLTGDMPNCPPGYRCLSFAQLDADSTAIAAGLADFGVEPGMPIALLLRPGLDFVSLVFALLKLGAVQVLIDPGMGLRNVVRSLIEVQPQGFIGGATVQAARHFLRHQFPAARFNVSVGRSWLAACKSLQEIRRRGAAQPNRPCFDAAADVAAAIIFTSGSTGPAKGVLYRHGNFARQVTEIRDFYGIQSGEIDVSCFPLFGLFNAAMGVTSVIPRMDVTRPARVDPRYVIAAVNDWQATQAFGSPAVWNIVGRYCEVNHLQLPSLRRVLSSGAPVAAHVLRRMTACIHPQGNMHTPYGATEALPVASIAASTVLRETWLRTEQGAGVCVGNRFPGTPWRVIRISDEPIRNLDDAQELPRGQIGELIVQGPVVTTEYVARPQANATAKICDIVGNGFWHRMGDVGYLDEHDRFWFCGRRSQRVRTEASHSTLSSRRGRGEGENQLKHSPPPDSLTNAEEASPVTLFTIPCEAVFNRHPDVFRSALVGISLPRPLGKGRSEGASSSPQAGAQHPVIVVEPQPDRFPRSKRQREKLIAELRALANTAEITVPIDDFLIRKSLPVDVRHNVKINREQLARWAARKIRPQSQRHMR